MRGRYELLLAACPRQEGSEQLRIAKELQAAHSGVRGMIKQHDDVHRSRHAPARRTCSDSRMQNDSSAAAAAAAGEYLLQLKRPLSPLMAASALLLHTAGQLSAHPPPHMLPFLVCSFAFRWHLMRRSIEGAFSSVIVACVQVHLPCHPAWSLGVPWSSTPVLVRNPLQRPMRIGNSQQDATCSADIGYVHLQLPILSSRRCAHPKVHSKQIIEILSGV